MADRMFTCAAAEDILNDLRLATGIEYAALARLALAYSLNTCGSDVPSSLDASGKEVRWISILGDDADAYRAIVHLIYGQPIYDEAFFSDRSILKDHVDNGCTLLWQLFTEGGRDRGGFLTLLMEHIGISPSAETFAGQIDLVVGTEDLTGERVVVPLNDTAVHPNPHLAMAGKPGVGKTQFLLKLLADIRQQSDWLTHFIVFDYKGDVASNGRFVEVTKAAVYKLPGGQLPVNPFVLTDYHEEAVLLSAREKAESFASISGRLGPVQKGHLTKAIVEAYKRRAKSSRPFPDFDEVFKIAAEMYASAGKNDDTLIEILRDLSQFKLFWNHGQEDDPIAGLISHTMIVDLHELPVLKEMVAYLVCERLYKEMAMLPDSHVDGTRRQIRTVLVLDEAHNYLPQRNLFLQRVVREGRSKGVAVFFASQSPADYEQDDFDFSELLELFFVFQSDGMTAAEIKSLMGVDGKTAKDLQARIPRLKPFQIISKPLVGGSNYTLMTAEPFYKAYR